MKKKWLWCLVALLALGNTSFSQAQEASDATEKAVVALENQWIHAQRTNNPDLIAPLLADRIVNTTSDGRVLNKAEILAFAKATKFIRSEYPELKVAVFGNTAIATSIWTGEFTDGSGKLVKAHSRYTDTWVKMPDGKWQCVASHGSAIEK